MAAVERIADSQVSAVSAENRFDAAYKAIMQLSMLALHANGYRTLTSSPGHHQTAIQALPQTIGLSNKEMIVLDGLRKRRNLSDYGGDSVPTALLAHVKAWLKASKPNLL